jgi:hypothetical protein
VSSPTLKNLLLKRTYQQQSLYCIISPSIYHCIQSSRIDFFFLPSGTYYILYVHYHFIVSSFDPRTVVLHILFYSLLTFIYISALSGQLASLYIYLFMYMMKLTKKGISRNKPSLLSFDKLCNLSFFFFFSSCACSTHMIDSIT